MSNTPRTDNAVRFAISRGMTLAPLAEFARDLEQENAALRELAARMATEMREIDHEFSSLRDYDARKEAQP